jgi:hypothetical protein
MKINFIPSVLHILSICFFLLETRVPSGFNGSINSNILTQELSEPLSIAVDEVKLLFFYCNIAYFLIFVLFYRMHGTYLRTKKM